jgi:hypothetical protein
MGSAGWMAGGVEKSPRGSYRNFLLIFLLLRLSSLGEQRRSIGRSGSCYHIGRKVFCSVLVEMGKKEGVGVHSWHAEENFFSSSHLPACLSAYCIIRPGGPGEGRR